MTLPPDGAAAERSQDARGQGPSATVTRAPEGHPPLAGSGGCPERPRIIKGQRDAIYHVVTTRIHAIDEVARAIEAERFESADKLAREYAYFLLLIVDGLGWGVEGEAVELDMSAKGLRYTFDLLHRSASRSLVIEQEEEAEIRAEREDSQLVLDASSEVFTTLEMQGDGDMTGGSAPSIHAPVMLNLTERDALRRHLVAKWSDASRLLADLVREEDHQGTVELTLPAADLRRVFTDIRDGFVTDRSDPEQALIVAGVCERVLGIGRGAR